MLTTRYLTSVLCLLTRVRSRVEPRLPGLARLLKFHLRVPELQKGVLRLGANALKIVRRDVASEPPDVSRRVAGDIQCNGLPRDEPKLVGHGLEYGAEFFDGFLPVRRRDVAPDLVEDGEVAEAGEVAQCGRFGDVVQECVGVRQEGEVGDGPALLRDKAAGEVVEAGEVAEDEAVLGERHEACFGVDLAADEQEVEHAAADWRRPVRAVALNVLVLPRREVDGLAFCDDRVRCLSVGLVCVAGALAGGCDVYGFLPDDQAVDAVADLGGNGEELGLGLIGDETVASTLAPTCFECTYGSLTLLS